MAPGTKTKMIGWALQCRKELPSCLHFTYRSSWSALAALFEGGNKSATKEIEKSGNQVKCRREASSQEVNKKKETSSIENSRNKGENAGGVGNVSKDRNKGANAKSDGTKGKETSSVKSSSTRDDKVGASEKDGNKCSSSALKTNESQAEKKPLGHGNSKEKSISSKKNENFRDSEKVASDHSSGLSKRNASQVEYKKTPSLRDGDKQDRTVAKTRIRDEVDDDMSNARLEGRSSVRSAGSDGTRWIPSTDRKRDEYKTGGDGRERDKEINGSRRQYMEHRDAEEAGGRESSVKDKVREMQVETIKNVTVEASKQLASLDRWNAADKAQQKTERDNLRRHRFMGIMIEEDNLSNSYTPWTSDRYYARERKAELLPESERGGRGRICMSKEEEEEEKAIRELKSRKELFYRTPGCIDSVQFGERLRMCIRRKDLEEGRKLHAELAEGYYDRYTYLGNLLIQMYGNCGELDSARSVFDNLDEKNVFSYNIMQAALIQNGRINEARQVFDSNPEKSLVSWNSMLAAYSSRGRLDEAKSLFESMPEKNIVSWTGMVQAFARDRRVEEARLLFDQMEDRDLVTWNVMLSGYAEKGMANEVKDLFEEMPIRDRVSWTAMISALSSCGEAREAIEYYHKMVLEGVQPNKVTCLTVLKACAENRDFAIAQKLHATFEENGMEQDMAIATALVDMYAKCGNLHYAKLVFDRMSERDVIAWTAMVSAYTNHGEFERAAELFRVMPIKNIISYNIMLGMLIQTGKLDEARTMFHKILDKNTSSWNLMISGYAQGGLGKEALELFTTMDMEGSRIDRTTFASALMACANIPAPELGRLIAEEIEVEELGNDPILMTALLIMHASYGNLQTALELFEGMEVKDEVAWGAMISGYLHNGLDWKAVDYFRLMLLMGRVPSRFTFISLLSACSHIGLVEECRWYFFSMMEDYKIAAEQDHYLCLIDLLGRAGHLERAEELVNTMPFVPNAEAWRVLLSACRMHKDKALPATGLDPCSGTPLSTLQAENGVESRRLEVEEPAAGMESPESKVLRAAAEAIEQRAAIEIEREQLKEQAEAEWYKKRAEAERERQRRRMEAEQERRRVEAERWQAEQKRAEAQRERDMRQAAEAELNRQREQQEQQVQQREQPRQNQIQVADHGFEIGDGNGYKYAAEVNHMAMQPMRRSYSGDDFEVRDKDVSRWTTHVEQVDPEEQEERYRMWREKYGERMREMFGDFLGPVAMGERPYARPVSTFDHLSSSQEKQQCQQQEEQVKPEEEDEDGDYYRLKQKRRKMKRQEERKVDADEYGSPEDNLRQKYQHYYSMTGGGSSFLKDAVYFYSKDGN